jgi:PilZ domain-containing protein
MRDISQTGAQISLARNGDVPDVFTLYLSESGGAQRQCRVVWRSSLAIGVEFIL